MDDAIYVPPGPLGLLGDLESSHQLLGLWAISSGIDMEILEQAPHYPLLGLGIHLGG